MRAFGKMFQEKSAFRQEGKRKNLKEKKIKNTLTKDTACLGGTLLWPSGGKKNPGRKFCGPSGKSA